jgi:hypothetical protein
MVIPVCWRNCWRSARSLHPPARRNAPEKRAAEAARQRGQQLIEQRFALRRRQIIRRVAMALKNQRQLRKQQLGHRIPCASLRAHSCSSW